MEEKHTDNQDSQGSQHNRFESVHNRLVEFSEEVQDQYDHEGDSFFKSVLQIFRFFDRKIDILTILAQIHQCAGNVHNAVKKLASNQDRSINEIEFRFATIDATTEEIDRYFE